MGFRFRKSIKLGGARINISKSGIGASIGGKGFRYIKKANGGTRTTVNIPGTGISYVKDSSGKSKSNTANAVAVNTTPVSVSKKSLVTFLNICSIPMIALGILLLLVAPVAGVFAIAIGIGERLLAKHYKDLMVMEEYNKKLRDGNKYKET